MTPTCTLKVISGPAAGSEVEVEHELIIGRRDADLTIADEEISRRHALVRPLPTGVLIEDLGSLNGTFVNGERITGPVTLTADATIRVGHSEISLQLAMVVATPEPEEPADDPGRTRMSPVVSEPIPQPQVTRIRPIPDEQPPQPEAAPQPPPIPQPQVTRVRPLPDAQPQQPEPIPQPQVTRVRPAVQAQAPQDERARVPGAQDQAKPPSLFKRIFGRRRGGK